MFLLEKRSNGKKERVYLMDFMKYFYPELVLPNAYFPFNLYGQWLFAWKEKKDFVYKDAIFDLDQERNWIKKMKDEKNVRFVLRRKTHFSDSGWLFDF